MNERRAPLQGTGAWQCSRTHPSRKATDHPPGTIAWSEHLAIWEVYAARYGREQSAERMAERGGFGWAEVVYLTGREPTTWEPYPNQRPWEPYP